MSTKLLDLKRALVASFIVASGTAGAAGPAPAAEAPATGDKDAMRATLMESREKNRGVTLHAAGASIAMVVTSVDGVYVIGRSQAASRIVVRLDRIDGVSASF